MTRSATLSRDFTQTDPLQPTVGQAYPSAYVYGNNNPNMYVDPSGLRGIRSEMVRFAGLVSRPTDPFLGGSNPVRYFGIDCADIISCKVAGEYADDHWDSKVLTGAAVRARTVYLAANYCKNIANSCQGRAAASRTPVPSRQTPWLRRSYPEQGSQTSTHTAGFLSL